MFQSINKTEYFLPKMTLFVYSVATHHSFMNSLQCCIVSVMSFALDTVHKDVICNWFSYVLPLIMKIFKKKRHQPTNSMPIFIICIALVSHWHQYLNVIPSSRLPLFTQKYEAFDFEIWWQYLQTVEASNVFDGIDFWRQRLHKS